MPGATNNNVLPWTVNRIPNERKANVAKRWTPILEKKKTKAKNHPLQL